MKTFDVFFFAVHTCRPTLQKQYIQGLSVIFGMNISSPSFSHLLMLPSDKEKKTF